MRLLKRSLWKAGIALAGLLLLALGMWLMVIVVWAPVSAAGTYERASGIAGPGTFTLQTPLTADLTVTAVAQDKLKQEDEQLQRGNSFPWTVLNTIGGPMLAALAAISVAFFGLYQWRGNQNAERKKEIATQDKELRDRAEDRFKTAVTALGDEKEGVQVGGAILLRSFLNPDDEEIYGRYYTQIFDLAVAYLRLSNTAQRPEDPDGIPHSIENPDDPLPLTPIRQALIVVFREAFPLARKELKKHLSEQNSKFKPEALDATHIQLDGAWLVEADLEQAWMALASLQKTDLRSARLSRADLFSADLREANLYQTDLQEANLRNAVLTGAKLFETNLTKAILLEATLIEADLTRANFTEADLRETDLTRAKLRDTNLTKARLNGRDLSTWSSNPGANLEEAKLRGVNLTEANLVGVNLTGAFFWGGTFKGADLRKANLTEVNLRNANLEGLSLRRAKLTRATLEDTNLKGANLHSANLEEAVLTRANLEGAELKRANLTKADLRGAKLTGANLLWTNLQDTDLRGVTGLTKEQLEACKAKGAIIDEDTTTSSPQSPVAPPTPEPRNDAQTPSAPPADADGSSAASSQQGPAS